MKICHVPILLFFAACSSAGGQTGQESWGCLPTEEATFDLSETTPLGFSGADVLGLVLGEHSVTLTWESGATTQATIVVSHLGTEARFVRKEWRSDSSGHEDLSLAEVECSDEVALDVDLHFMTEDGTFDERFDSTLGASVADQAALSTTVRLQDLRGDYVATEINPDDFESVLLIFDFRVDASGVKGSVSGQATRVESSGPDGTASATSFEVADF